MNVRSWRWRSARRSEQGAQSLEWIGLGSFVLAAMSAATIYAHDHLGAEFGNLLFGHLKSIFPQ